MSLETLKFDPCSDLGTVVSDLSGVLWKVHWSTLEFKRLCVIGILYQLVGVLNDGSGEESTITSLLEFSIGSGDPNDLAIVKARYGPLT